MILASSGYPFLSVMWSIFIFFAWVMFIWLMILVYSDLFRRSDVSGWGKAGWVIFLIILPFLGVLVYLIARGGSMHKRDIAQAKAADAATREYIQQAAGSQASSAEELQKLADLRDRGVLSQEEFDAQKAKILA